MSPKLPRQPQTLPDFIQASIDTFSRDTELYNQVRSRVDNGMKATEAFSAVADGMRLSPAVVQGAYYRLLHHLDWEDAQEIPNAKTLQSLKDADKELAARGGQPEFNTAQEAIAYFRKISEEAPS